MAQILTPFNIGDVEIKNRIVMPPMCMYKAKDNNGKPRCFHRTHYAARSLGGVGLIIVEATAVSLDGRISVNDLGLWSDEQIADHERLVKDASKYGAIMAIQLAHAGRKSMATAEPIAPSAIKFSSEYATPKAMSADEIVKFKANFVAAAKRAEQAGYKLIEIHAAHGYLINEFLSKVANTRTDAYGGSFENRTRLLKEILTEVKAAVNVPVGVRISADSWLKADYDISETIELCRELECLGVSFLHISAGGIHEQVDNAPKFEPLYQCGYAKAVKNVVKVPVIAVGLITTAEQGEEILKNGICDAVAYGRELLRNPNFAFTAMLRFGAREQIDRSYLRAF
ncbi:NADH:flavin oxidoreductase/NADH oxidase [Campylobacter sp. faydin G-140]|uniref:NADH:flavin oxidoreductase/NADH oxidase n=1 Tax=Campylobacter anatolicus TaxID=2829105 RepID=UPI001BA1DECD|nr:NADH:flavin oxidoreductase/NADH oxidase [Campylobacter anatolicus]MBR8465229.1 NADH:flavin oxidoreductase/NADH oxidase [Campylobacter anatolicus]